ncbi:MAG: phosphoglycerate dehydrogenase [Schlesneria sp.]|nr:phosphoglycerate dehydrogenase [Schlesneria sp.]
MRVVITCPPMIRSIQHYSHLLTDHGIEFHCPEFTQILSEPELLELIPQFDGWIIGDDPATRRVFETAVRGKLRAAVKFGVGIDNVDFAAARDLGLPITNTPGMFGQEVADIAQCYVIALARKIFDVHRGVVAERWPKPVGYSLADKTAAVVGFGDIGRQTAKRLLASGMKVIAYDPRFAPAPGLEAVESAAWPDRIQEAQVIVLTCALTPENRHLLNASTFAMCKRGVDIVNVSRGPLIDEAALSQALESGQVSAAALEVFEVEPLSATSPLRQFEQCLFGSHNASNTRDAVIRTSERAIGLLLEMLKVKAPT